MIEIQATADEVGRRIVASLRANAFFTTAWEQVDANCGKEFFERLFAEIITKAYRITLPANEPLRPCAACGYGGKHLDAPPCDTCPAWPKHPHQSVPITLDELKIENAQLRAVITDNDPDFFKRKCRVCGCDWNHPCDDHDCWVDDDLCSVCARKPEGSDKEC